MGRGEGMVGKMVRKVDTQEKKISSCHLYTCQCDKINTKTWHFLDNCLKLRLTCTYRWKWNLMFWMIRCAMSVKVPDVGESLHHFSVPMWHVCSTTVNFAGQPSIKDLEENSISRLSRKVETDLVQAVGSPFVGNVRRCCETSRVHLSVHAKYSTIIFDTYQGSFRLLSLLLQN